MLKLNLQYFGHLMRRTVSFEKTLMLGKIAGGRRRGQQKMRWLNGITNSWTWVWVNSGSWWWTGRPGVLRFMGLQRVRHDWATKLNWTELHVKRNFSVVIRLMTLRWEIILNYSGGLSLTTWVFKIRETFLGQRGTTLPVLKMEEGIHEPTHLGNL